MKMLGRRLAIATVIAGYHMHQIRESAKAVIQTYRQAIKARQ